MTDSYRVRIEKERLVFSAAHFITYDGDVCEPLHGHNYHVAAEVRGPLDENHYVVDFISLRDALERRSGLRPTELEVAVDECDGQWGICTLVEE